MSNTLFLVHYFGKKKFPMIADNIQNIFEIKPKNKQTEKSKKST